MRITESSKERFWKAVAKGDACWEWTGYTKADGYGRLMLHFGKKPKCVTAHRFSYALHNGAIPKGQNVLHRCDNRSCVNPSHLFLGTQSDNLRDAVKKGRAPGAKLTPDEVAEIRSRLPMKLREISEEYGISMAQAHNIRSGKQWV